MNDFIKKITAELPAEFRAGTNKPLLDTFGRVHDYLRISVTDKCNLRCRYCMPPEGIELKRREEILSLEELLRITQVFAKMGITKVRLTGGEPLVRRNLEWLIDQISKIPTIKSIALTTNAILLKDKMEVIKKTGVTHLNISLDTLREERFEQIALRGDFKPTMAGIEAALEADYHPLKINAVVMGGVNDDELLDFVEFVKDKPINIRFIEYMPFDGNAWKQGKMVSYKKMRETIESRYELKEITEGRHPSDVGLDFSIDGFLGTVSFVTSMTNDFCGACSRIRLLCDGSLKSCFFFPPEAQLRDVLRAKATDEEIENVIRWTIWQKKSGHAPMEELASMPNLSMIQIGG